MIERVTRALGLKPGEWAISSLMFLYIFGVLTFYYILKPLRSALFLSELPAIDLPKAYLMTAVLAGPVVTLAFRLGRRLSAVALLTWTNVAIIATLFFFRWAIERDLPQLPYAYFVYVQIVSVLSVGQFWLFAGHIYDHRQAKRIYGLLGVGAIAGASAGSFITDAFRDSSAEVLILTSIGICAALIAVSQLAWRLRRQDAAGRARPVRRFAAPRERLRDLYALIAGSRHLSLMILLVFLTMIASQIADWQVEAAIQETFAHLPKEEMAKEIMGFRARFNNWTNLAGLALQLAFTGVVVRRFGIGAAILFLPVGLFVTSLGVLIAPSLATVTVALGANSIFRYSINRSGLEFLYLPLSAEVRTRVKLFIDVFVDRFGRATAALIILGLNSGWLDVGLRGTALAVVTMTALCVFVGLRLRGTYVEAFREQLAGRTIDLESMDRFVTDPTSVRLLIEALEEGQERQILFALRLLQSSRGVDFAPQLLPLLEHASPFVREAAARTLQALPRSSAKEAEGLLADSAAGVRQAAVEYLCDQDTARRSAELERLLDHPDSKIRLAAARVAAERESARHRPSPERIRTDILPMLADRRRRGAAREALVGQGPRIVGILSQALADPRSALALKREIPWVLSRLPSEEVSEILIAHLGVEDTMLRYRIVKALNRLHEVRPELPKPHPSIAEEAYAETQAYYEALALTSALGPGGTGGGRRLLNRALKERLDQNIEIIFRLLGLQYPQRDMYVAYNALKDTRTDRRAAAIEFLDNVLHKNLKSLILPLLEESSMERLIDRASHEFGIPKRSREEALRLILDQSDAWLKVCALHLVGAEQIRELDDRCRLLSSDPDPVVRETADWATKALASAA